MRAIKRPTFWPIAHLAALVGEGPVFVLAPHPDDESFGCGGLIAACAAAGVQVHMRVLTDGARSHPVSLTWPPKRIAARRRVELHGALRRLGLMETPRVRWDEARDGLLLFDRRRQRRIAESLSAELSRWPAPVLLAPWRLDRHPDHVATSLIADCAAETCPRARQLRYLVWAPKTLLRASLAADEVVVRFPIWEWRAQKRAALYAHRTQVTRLIDDVPARAHTPPLAAALGSYEMFVMRRGSRAQGALARTIDKDA